MTLYLLYTWLLANLLHPLIWWLVSAAPGSRPWMKLGIGEAISLMGVSSQLSYPALFLAGLGLNCIVNARQQLYTSLFVWIVTVAGSIILEAVAAMLFLGPFQWKTLAVFIPAVLAATLAILIRHNQFGKMINLYNNRI